MDRILKILKKENGPRASSAPALELNTIIFKHVYWYMQQISGERLQDHWSSGFIFDDENQQKIEKKTEYLNTESPILLDEATCSHVLFEHWSFSCLALHTGFQTPTTYRGKNEGTGT